MSFDDEVAAVQAGERSAVDAAEALIQQLPDDELLGLLDGDEGRALGANLFAVEVAGYTSKDEGEALVASVDGALAHLPPPVGTWPISAIGSAIYGFLGRKRLIPGGDRVRLTLRPHDEALIARTRVTVDLALQSLYRRDPQTHRWSPREHDHLLSAGQHRGDPAATTAPLEVPWTDPGSAARMAP